MDYLSRSLLFKATNVPRFIFQTCDNVSEQFVLRTSRDVVDCFSYQILQCIDICRKGVIQVFITSIRKHITRIGHPKSITTEFDHKYFVDQNFLLINLLQYLEVSYISSNCVSTMQSFSHHYFKMSYLKCYSFGVSVIYGTKCIVSRANFFLAINFK